MHQASRRLLPSTLMPAPARPGRCSSRRLSYRSAASNESTSSVNAGAAPVSNSSSFTLTNSSIDSCGPARDKEPEATPVRRPESTRNSPVKSVDLAAYYTFTKRNSTIVHDLSPGLSGFLEYRKLNGTWRPFLFQTIGHQLVLYRVHSTHQVLVMSTDIRCASEIALEYDGVSDRENTRLLRLGINGTTITLRAVTHRAAMYWVDVCVVEMAKVLVTVTELTNTFLFDTGRGCSVSETANLCKLLAIPHARNLKTRSSTKSTRYCLCASGHPLHLPHPCVGFAFQLAHLNLRLLACY
ncbi:hypothetical protein F441_02172 [Phytophthora nicotianae CJ01A1]|uniref:Uncharacterized protein n=2 Tax=Phytophthora nicotianae TaxID=4792 RepID=W2HI64_PHYNI|nr:hypothetical protein L915_02111 [Phytophthora nicotianae]ETL48317.1 hypothetical protein L916_02075 [Phytophthora nicotianae]ETP24914.1 hypothetical protein F441_02172 [Phytophthora nicotianae CJ01A1]